MPFPQAINSRMQSLAGLGRGGDTAMGHLTPGEVVVPLSITRMYPGLVNAISDAIKARGRNPADFIVGAPGGNVNPATGFEEFMEGGGGDSDGPGGDGGMGGGDSGGGSDTEGSPGHDASGGFGSGVGDVGSNDAGGSSIGADVETQGTPNNPGIGPGFGPGSELTFGGIPNTTVDAMAPEQQTLDRTFSLSNLSPTEKLGTSLPDDFFDTPQPTQTPSRVEGPAPSQRQSQTAVDKEAMDKAKAGQPGLGEAAMDTVKDMTRPSLPGVLGTIAGLVNPAFGALATIGRFGYGVADRMQTPGYVDYGQSQPDMAPSAPPGGPLGGGSADYAQAVAGKLSSGLPKGQIGVPGIMDMGRTVGPVPNSAGPLPPQDAARIADQLGVSNDALQARAQIATYALNANGADFRTPEAAALWETLLAQSYSPNPGLLDIERQYMAQVLGFGDQAYEGEDQAAFTLAGTGAPIRRSQVAV